MALAGFSHTVAWSEFRVVRQRPQGAQEDAYIRVNFSYTYRTQQQSGGPCRVASVSMTIGVVRDRSWVVRGQQTASLLRHEQGHYDITALGARDAYNRISALALPRCADIRGEAQRIRQQIQGQIDQANRRYDTQTSHGTNATAQQTWEASIRAAKQRPNGTIANLPQ